MKRLILLAICATLMLVGSLSPSPTVASGSNGPGAPKGEKGRRQTATPTSLPVITPTGTAVRTATNTVTATTTAPATFTPTATPTASTDQREQETVNLINERRVAMGLGVLRVDLALVSAARRLSTDIGPAGLCQHTGTDGSSPWSRIADAGYTGTALGEVVGCGFSTAQGVVDAWWNSPGHYAILTDPNANDIGCGWWIPSSGYGWQTCDTGQSAR